MLVVDEKSTGTITIESCLMVTRININDWLIITLTGSAIPSSALYSLLIAIHQSRDCCMGVGNGRVLSESGMEIEWEELVGEPRLYLASHPIKVHLNVEFRGLRFCRNRTGFL